MSSTLLKNKTDSESATLCCSESEPDNSAPPSNLKSPALSEQAAIFFSATAVGIALFCSGAAGLINQVVWQRSLKVVLGGSETVCSTVVVLVFMAGLGLGSWWSGRRAHRFTNPLSTFGWLEAILGIVNLGVCALLAADISDSVFAMQRMAVSLGVPLLLVYATGATLILFVPCLLMGATMPLAAEVCQRNFGFRNARLLSWLFFVNTTGSVLGAILASGSMIPQNGLIVSMQIAVGLNLFAGCLLLFLTKSTRTGKKATPAKLADAAHESQTKRVWWVPGAAETLALGLGFCSLGYEMHLFRLMPLKHLPLPFTFAAVLTGFLGFWSIGAALSSRKRGLTITNALKLCAAGCVLSIALSAMDSYTAIHGTGSLIAFVIRKTPFFLPCLLFGYLFARVTEQAAKSWGRDVGRIYVWNTAGSCLGILLMTFVGYEIPFFLAVVALSLVLLSLTGCVSGLEQTGQSDRSTPKAIPLLTAIGLVVACLFIDTTQIISGYRLFCGRDGVIVVHDNGDLVWDGLWHSKLSSNDDHIGTHNWHLATMPVISHAEKPIHQACVIGVGTGITASTIAKLDEVEQVDAYDISRVLEDVFATYPEGTLNLTSNPKINLIWQDARSGLELNPKKYDLIQTQPLYLKQAGSALLNSREFFELVSRRLNPDGVFCLYSNGTPEQAFVVRETADSVFRYRESFFNGYLVILSNDPIELNADTLARRLNSNDPLWNEIRNNETTSSADLILSALDNPQLPMFDGELLITDDKPVVEYPRQLRDRIQLTRLPFSLPEPDASHSHRNHQ